MEFSVCPIFYIEKSLMLGGINRCSGNKSKSIPHTVQRLCKFWKKIKGLCIFGEISVLTVVLHIIINQLKSSCSPDNMRGTVLFHSTLFKITFKVKLPTFTSVLPCDGRSVFLFQKSHQSLTIEKSPTVKI